MQTSLAELEYLRLVDAICNDSWLRHPQAAALAYGSPALLWLATPRHVHLYQVGFDFRREPQSLADLLKPCGFDVGDRELVLHGSSGDAVPSAFCKQPPVVVEDEWCLAPVSVGLVTWSGHMALLECLLATVLEELQLRFFSAELSGQIAFFKSVFEALPHGILVNDEAGVVQYRNREFRRSFPDQERLEQLFGVHTRPKHWQESAIFHCLKSRSMVQGTLESGSGWRYTMESTPIVLYDKTLLGAVTVFHLNRA